MQLPMHDTIFTLKYSDRLALGNSADPDQMLQNAASDQGLHCLVFTQQYFRHINELGQTVV